MNKHLEFSICISILNEEEHLEKCIESIIESSKDFRCELLFLNNGSSDTSGEILNRYEALDNFNIITLSETVELQSARNMLLNRCKSNLAVFLDADGQVSTNYFSTLVKNLSKDISIYSGPVSEQSSRANIFYELHYLSLIKSDQNFLIGANFVVKVSDALKVGGFPDITYKRGDETALIKLMKENGFKQQYVDELTASNHFVSNPIDFIGSFYYEGQNAFLYMLYFNESLIFKSIYKSIFITGFVLFFIALSMMNHYIFFLGLLVFLAKFSYQHKYWLSLFSQYKKMISLESTKGLLLTLLAHIAHELGFWHSMLINKKPKAWLDHSKELN